MRSIFHFLCAAVLLTTVGCAHYEYDIVQPANLAQHVGEKQSVRFQLDALDYDFISYADRLVVRISNPSENAIQLVEDRSYVVDPLGQSHPIRGRMIAPGSYIKLILPPLRPRVEADGPRFGFGLGIVADGRPGRGYYGPYRRGFYDGAYGYDEPLYYTVYDGSEMYWGWHGETDVRLSLYFQPDAGLPPDTQPTATTEPAPTTERGDGTMHPFIHSFDLHRRKM